MVDNKREQVRSMIQRRASRALAERTATMMNRDHAEAIRLNLQQLSSAVAFEIAEEYAFLELADIMEWKRIRVRR